MGDLATLLRWFLASFDIGMLPDHPPATGDGTRNCKCSWQIERGMGLRSSRWCRSSKVVAPLLHASCDKRRGFSARRWVSGGYGGESTQSGWSFCSSSFPVAHPIYCRYASFTFD